MNLDLQAVNPAVEFVRLPLTYSVQAARGIGLVAPYDFALDDECWRWLPAGVPLYVTRTASLEDTTVSEAQAQAVSDASAVMPAIRSLAAADPASVGYACTSGSFINGIAGEVALRSVMKHAGAPAAVTTSGALLEALRELGVTRLAIATPYNEVLTHGLADFLAAAGIQVVRAGYLDCDRDIRQVGYEAVRAMAAEVDHSEAQAIFFSCTNLRTFDVIAELEQRYDKPILSANQVTIWAALRAAQLPLPVLPQRLFTQNEQQTTSGVGVNYDDVIIAG